MPEPAARESFTKHTRYAALRVPANKCSKVLKELSEHILKLPKVGLPALTMQHTGDGAIRDVGYLQPYAGIFGLQIAPVVKPEAGDPGQSRVVMLKYVVGEDGETSESWEDTWCVEPLVA